MTNYKKPKDVAIENYIQLIEKNIISLRIMLKHLKENQIRDALITYHDLVCTFSSLLSYYTKVVKDFL